MIKPFEKKAYTELQYILIQTYSNVRCSMMLYCMICQRGNQRFFNRVRFEIWVKGILNVVCTLSKTFLITLQFVCFGYRSLLNIWGHITTVPACSSGTLTNLLSHMLQTQDTTPHPIPVYRHGADLSLCYPLMWNVTLEYTATHFNVLGIKVRPDREILPQPSTHTSKC